MSGAGTVALVFVVLASIPGGPGTPETYKRYVISSGPTEGLVGQPQGTITWAYQKIAASFNVFGGLPVPQSSASSPLGNTISSCNSYARHMIPLLEEATEQFLGSSIADYRCVFVPKGYQLTNYRQPYDMSNPQHIVPKNPYKIEKIPNKYIHPLPAGPFCLRIRTSYPQSVLEHDDNLEGTVVASCDKSKGDDGYYRPVNCQIVSKDGSKEFIKNKAFDEAALNDLREGLGCSIDPGPKDPENGRYTYNINYEIAHDDDDN